MIKTLVHTLGSRFLVSILNLALLFITTKLMGAENKGAISLLVLNLSIAAVLSGIFGGPSLVYLVPRYPLRHLFLLAYIASAFASSLLTVLAYVDVLPMQLPPMHLFFLSFLECSIAAHFMIMLGLEKVHSQNRLSVLKVLITVGVLVFIFLKGASLSFDAFTLAYSISLFLVFILSLLPFSKELLSNGSESQSFLATIKSSASYGALVQSGNIAQLLNYRLSFFLLEFIISPPSLALIRIGVYSASLQVAEALWQFARSVSIVQYSKVSNMTDVKEALRISLQLGKMNYVVTLVGLSVLLLIPANWYVGILGEEFFEVKTHIGYLSIGILMLSFSNALSHYFSGIGEHKYNTQSSILGLFLTIALAYPSILYLDTIGAALVASIVYGFQTIYQFVMLKRTTDVQMADVIIGWSDIREFKEKVLGRN